MRSTEGKYSNLLSMSGMILEYRSLKLTLSITRWTHPQHKLFLLARSRCYQDSQRLTYDTVISLHLLYTSMNHWKHTQKSQSPHWSFPFPHIWSLFLLLFHFPFHLLEISFIRRRDIFFFKKKHDHIRDR